MEIYYKEKNGKIKYRDELCDIVKEEIVPFGNHCEAEAYVYIILYKGERVTVYGETTGYDCGGSDF